MQKAELHASVYIPHIHNFGKRVRMRRRENTLEQKSFKWKLTGKLAYDAIMHK